MSFKKRYNQIVLMTIVVCNSCFVNAQFIFDYYDGDLDMIVGYQNGKLFLYENTGGVGTMNFSLLPVQLTDLNGDNILVSGTAYPQLFDLNNNGLLDLIIDQSQEGIHYFENVGVPNNYEFSLVTENLGNVQLITPD